MVRMDPAPVCSCRLSVPRHLADGRSSFHGQMQRQGCRPPGVLIKDLICDGAVMLPFHIPAAQGGSGPRGRGWGVCSCIPQAPYFFLPLIPTTITQGILNPFYRRQDQGSEGFY